MLPYLIFRKPNSNQQSSAGGISCGVYFPLLLFHFEKTISVVFVRGILSFKANMNVRKFRMRWLTVAL